MLSQLANYLFAQHKVIIPGIGCFELHQHAAQLDFAEKLIHPPYYSVQYSRHDKPDQKQLAYLLSQDITAADLERFGHTLKQEAADREIVWAGIGRLRYADHNLHFTPVFKNKLLHAVEAHKVIRRQEEHEVLRGERAYSSTELKKEMPVIHKRKYWLLAAEIIAILAIAFIVYHFIQNGFQLHATGNEQRIIQN